MLLMTRLAPAVTLIKTELSIFFFHPLYTDVRDELLQSLPPSDNSATLDQILFGNQNLCFEENIKIFEAVQRYIVKSKHILIL